MSARSTGRRLVMTEEIRLSEGVMAEEIRVVVPLFSVNSQ